MLGRTEFGRGFYSFINDNHTSPVIFGSEKEDEARNRLAEVFGYRCKCICSIIYYYKNVNNRDQRLALSDRKVNCLIFITFFYSRKNLVSVEDNLTS